MPLLQVPNVPQDMYARLSLAAQRQNLTIAQQTIVLIQKGLGAPQSNKGRRCSALERSRTRLVPRQAREADYTVFVREDRTR
jgi:hypothetical protein